MRRWKSHKIVEAEPIAAIAADKSSVIAGGEVIPVPKSFFGQGTPQLGDYLVRYLSWSPQQAFENGYTEVTDD